MPERRSGRTTAQLVVAGLKECHICNFCWNITGFTRHYNSCKKQSESRQRALQATTNAQTFTSSATSLSLAQLQAKHSSSVFTLDVPRLLDDNHSSQDVAPLSSEGLGSELGDDGRTLDIDSAEGKHSKLLKYYKLELIVNSCLWQTLSSNSLDGSTACSITPTGAQQSYGICSLSTAVLAHFPFCSPNPALEGDTRVQYHARPHRCQAGFSILRTQPVARPNYFRGRVAPWAPFQSHADFRFAQNALKSGLTREHVDEFLEIHHLASNSSVSTKNYGELQKLQDQCAHQLAPVSLLVN